MKTLLSLFDYSGAWSAPFADNGWEVIQWDIKLYDFMDINFLDSCETCFDLFAHNDIQGIIAAPPCTDFAVSGAQYWKRKDANGTTTKAVEFVHQVQRLADLYKPTDPDYFTEMPDSTFFWAVENPVGRMGKLTGMDKPYYFHPHEFTGWLNPCAGVLEKLADIRGKGGYNVTTVENELVLTFNAYTKKTGLWGEFNRNMEKVPVPPVKTSPQGSPTQRLGGSSIKTKELRSNTPAGFALAFYEANKNYQVTI